MKDDSEIMNPLIQSFSLIPYWWNGCIDTVLQTTCVYVYTHQDRHTPNMTAGVGKGCFAIIYFPYSISHRFVGFRKPSGNLQAGLQI